MERESAVFLFSRGKRMKCVFNSTQGALTDFRSGVGGSAGVKAVEGKQLNAANA